MNDFTHPYRSCLCLASRRLARVVTQIYDEALSETGLRITQFSVLTALDQDIDDGPRLSAVAAALDMEPSTLTRALEPLRRSGLVTLTSGSDRRERRARLTPDGAAVLKQANAKWQKTQSELAQTIGEEDFRSLLDLLDRSRRTLDDHTSNHPMECSP